MAKLTKSLCLTLFTYVIFSNTGHAVVTMVPTVEVEIDYVENLDLIKTNGRSDWVTQITPAFQLNVDSQKLVADLNYSVNTLHHQTHSDLDDQYELIDGLFSFKLIPRALSLDLVLEERQQTVNFDQPTGYQQLTGTQNLVESTMYGARTIWNSRPFGLINTQMEVGHYVNEENVDSNTSIAGLSIAPYRSLGLISWNWQSNYRSSDYDNGVRSGRVNNELTAFIRPTNLTSFYVSVGYEKDARSSAFASETNSGLSHTVGLTWNPLGKADINVRYEDHHFGQFFAADLSIEFDRLELIFNADQELTTENNVNRETFFDPDQTLTSIQGGDDSESFKQDVVKLTAIYNYSRGSFKYTMSSEEREDVLQGFLPKRRQLDRQRIDWRHDLTPQIDIAQSFQLTDRRTSTGLEVDEAYAVLRLNYYPTSMVKLSLFALFNTNSSPSVSNDYISKVLGLNFKVEF